MRSKLLLSLIIPVRQGEKYISGLFDQLKGLPIDQFEVVFVDDSSIDGTQSKVGEIFGGSSINFKLLNSTGSGPGAARNSGLEVVQGEYIAFLDADDLVDANLLLRLCSRMEHECSDLAIFNHCRLYPDGSKRINQRSDLLQCSSSISNEAGKLKLLDNFNVAWNKVYRRSLIESLQVRFPVGIYEDIPWSISCLFGASKVITEPTVAYTYRQHPVSALKVVGAPHLVLPLQYERAIDFCVRHHCTDEWRRALVGRAVQHGLLIAYKRKRMGFLHRRQIFIGLLELVDRFDEHHTVQGTERLSGIQRMAFRIRSATVLELQHFGGRVVRLGRRAIKGWK
ncbi:glycosyltransferase [Marinobacter sp. P4B1]|uniref:glycosyltransferase n=1 Tax=Marinobacter sp. P4B1 TaxID=1119533 RepID=UPI00130D51D0|nr:glycosyltransferase [Marinobacter sp. P4B1]